MSDLTDAIKNLDDKHLACRDLGHRWSLQSHVARVVEWATSHEPVVERIVRCTVCRTTRTEQVRRSDGQMIRRNYRYPDGYCFEPGIAGRGGMKKDPFRREWIERTPLKVEDA